MSNFYEQAFVRNWGVLTTEEQLKLKNANVALVGCGGVGGIAAITIARLGIGSITCFDADHFEASNINRQLLATSDVLNHSKALTAKEHLLSINPEMNVTADETRINNENALEKLKGFNVILDATDNLISRLIIHRAAKKLNTPSIWIAVTPPLRGGVMSLDPNGADYEDILRHPSKGLEITPEVSAAVNALKDGRAQHSINHGALPEWANLYTTGQAPWAVIAPVANIVGLLAAHEVMKWIIKREEWTPCIGPEMIKIDLASNKSMVERITPESGSWDNTTL